MFVDHWIVATHSRIKLGDVVIREEIHGDEKCQRHMKKPTGKRNQTTI